MINESVRECERKRVRILQLRNYVSIRNYLAFNTPQFVALVFDDGALLVLAGRVFQIRYCKSSFSFHEQKR